MLVKAVIVSLQYGLSCRVTWKSPGGGIVLVSPAFFKSTQPTYHLPPVVASVMVDFTYIEFSVTLISVISFLLTTANLGEEWGRGSGYRWDRLNLALLAVLRPFPSDFHS